MTVAGMEYGSVHHITRSEVCFGFDIPPEANAYLQQAAAEVASSEVAQQSLENARHSAPDNLQVLVALYKFHFYRGDIHKAMDYVFQTLVKSSRQGQFSHDWKTLSADSADWKDPCGPARVFLYSLKALAFIRLRQNDPDDAQSILDVLERLDPSDQVGAGVIRDLLNGISDA